MDKKIPKEFFYWWLVMRLTNVLLFIKKGIRPYFILCIIILIFEFSLSTVSFFIRGPQILFLNNKQVDLSVQRILCLGDSFTYGLGADQEYSYPAQLEKLLNYNNPERKFQVFYLGINGLSSSIVANNLRTNIEKYRPNILLILTGANDHWNLHQSNILEVLNDKKINQRVIKIKKFLYNFKTFRLIQTVADKITHRFIITRENTQNTVKFSNITNSSLLQDLLKYNYRKMIQTIETFDGTIKLYVQNYPTGPEHINRMINRIAAEEKLNIIDQNAAFLKIPISHLVSNDGWHLNAQGYNLMAKNIYAEFLKTGLVYNDIAKDMEIIKKEDKNEVIRLDENTWKFVLSEIAKHPEKIIYKRGDVWCLIANNTIELPEIELLPGKYALEIKAKGTSVDKIYPLVGFYYKFKKAPLELVKNKINKIYVDGNWKNYCSERIIINEKENFIFYISFENDAIKIEEGKQSDRNLYVGKVILKKLLK
ncbi:MAG: GDSL-type esterase/lipase family protein [Candidatus Omnitrophota bacterium]